MKKLLILLSLILLAGCSSVVSEKNYENDEEGYIAHNMVAFAKLETALDEMLLQMDSYEEYYDESTSSQWEEDTERVSNNLKEILDEITNVTPPEGPLTEVHELTVEGLEGYYLLAEVYLDGIRNEDAEMLFAALVGFEQGTDDMEEAREALSEYNDSKF